MDLLEDIRHKGISVPFLLMTCDDDYLIKQQAQFLMAVLTAVKLNVI